MKKIGFLVACALAFPAVAEGAGLVIRCSTAGDALGAVDVYALNSKTIVIRESDMAGGRTVYAVSALPGSGLIVALERGQALTLVGMTKKSIAFGGGISNAALLRLGAKPTQAGVRRSGYYARGGNVYMITCGN
jgi:hypothetical protein